MRLLLGQVGGEVLGGRAVQGCFRQQAAHGLGRRQGADLADEGAESATELDRPPGSLAVPEGEAPRLAGGGGDDDPVMGDLLHPPGAGAEQDVVAGAAFEDHFLVELPQTRPVRPEPHRVIAAVGDGAGVHPRQQEGAAPGGEQVVVPVPGEQRPQVGEFGGGIMAGEHLQHRLQGAVGQLPEGPGAADQGADLRRRVRPLAAEGCHLLGEHVQGILRYPQRLDLAAPHAPGNHRALQEIAAELGKDAPDAHRLHPVAGAADALQTARHRARRFHLQHQVDRAHVDAQLQGAGGDDAAQAALLQSRASISLRFSLDTLPWWARTSSRPASSLSLRESRSHRPRLLTKTRVERWVTISERSAG